MRLSPVLQSKATALNIKYCNNYSWPEDPKSSARTRSYLVLIFPLYLVERPQNPFQTLEFSCDHQLK